jgi:hypothetical protein
MITVGEEIAGADIRSLLEVRSIYFQLEKKSPAPTFARSLKSGVSTSRERFYYLSQSRRR